MKVTTLVHFSLGGGNYVAPGTVFTDEGGEPIPAWVMEEVKDGRSTVEVVDPTPAIVEDAEGDVEAKGEDEGTPAPAPVRKVRVKK